MKQYFFLMLICAMHAVSAMDDFDHYDVGDACDDPFGMQGRIRAMNLDVPYPAEPTSAQKEADYKKYKNMAPMLKELEEIHVHLAQIKDRKGLDGELWPEERIAYQRMQKVVGSLIKADDEMDAE